MAFMTRARVEFLTEGALFSTRETVAVDTRDHRATSSSLIHAPSSFAPRREDQMPYTPHREIVMSLRTASPNSVSAGPSSTRNKTRLCDPEPVRDGRPILPRVPSAPRGSDVSPEIGR